MAKSLEDKIFERVIRENLPDKQSELSYSKTNPPESRKALQRSYWKAHRGPDARADIDSQVAGMEAPEADQRTLGDILPIPRDEWENYSGISDGDVPSEKMAYLYDLAYDVAYGREGSDLSQEDLAQIGELVYDQFGFDWLQVVGGHGADASADAARDEYYDDVGSGVYDGSDMLRECHEGDIRKAIRAIILEGAILPNRKSQEIFKENTFSSNRMLELAGLPRD